MERDRRGYLQPAAQGFGQSLRQARGKLSQSKLARLAGFDHSYISRLEAGERTPTREAVERLIEALRIDAPEAEALRMAAGYMPEVKEAIYLNPLVGQLDSAIRQAPPDLCIWAEQTISAMLAHLERAYHDYSQSAT